MMDASHFEIIRYMFVLTLSSTPTVTIAHVKPKSSQQELILRGKLQIVTHVGGKEHLETMSKVHIKIKLDSDTAEVEGQLTYVHWNMMLGFLLSRFRLVLS